MAQGRFSIMGIVNITPDSFSDGGRYLDARTALAHCEKLMRDGADVLDLGAESTRPGAQSITSEEEWRRLEPVLNQLGKTMNAAAISIDTQKPEIARRCAEEFGLGWINNVSGVYDKPTLRALAKTRTAYIAMHMQGTPETMQRLPLEAPDVIRVVEEHFEHSTAELAESGFSPERVYVDPGIGFGKNDGANMRIIAHLPTWSSAYNLCVGVSRKSFIGRLLNLDAPADRDPPSKMLELGLALAGVKLIRTHDVRGLARLREMMC